jgi:hypothetical protein
MVIRIFGHIRLEAEFLFPPFRLLVVVFVGGVQFDETGNFAHGILVALVVLHGFAVLGVGNIVVIVWVILMLIFI